MLGGRHWPTLADSGRVNQAPAGPGSDRLGWPTTHSGHDDRMFLGRVVTFDPLNVETWVRTIVVCSTWCLVTGLFW